MYVYIALYTPTHPTSAGALHPLPAPHYVRVILSPLTLTAEEYRTYLGFQGLPHHFTSLQYIGTVSDGIARAILLPKDTVAVSVEGMEYDMALETEDELFEYMKFVRTTVALEMQRPTFALSRRTGATAATTTTTPTNLNSLQSLQAFHMPTVDSIRQTAREWEGNLSEIPVLSEEDPVLVFQYTIGQDSREMVTQWRLILQHFGAKLRYYIKQSESPEMLWRLRGGGWLRVSPTILQIEALLRPSYKTIHQLSTGHLIDERENILWESLLGTQVFPNVSIVATLTLYKTFLTLKKPTQVLESWLTEAQRDFLQQLMESGIPFSLEHAFGLFTANKYQKVHLPQSSQLSPLPAFESSRITVQARDTQASPWQTMEALGTQATPTMSTNAAAALTAQTAAETTAVQKELRRLLVEYQETSEGPAAPLDLQPYTFLLHLLHESKDRSKDLEPVLRLFRQSKMDLQGTVVSLHQLTSLLSDNTAFLEGEKEEEVLEARLFLELFQYPFEVRLPEQKTKLFRLLLQMFSRQCLKAAEGKRAPAAEVWLAFLAFLRRHKLDFVGFFGTQMEFNEIMREFGWSQKRIATGKVWTNMEIIPQ